MHNIEQPKEAALEVESGSQSAEKKSTHRIIFSRRAFISMAACCAAAFLYFLIRWVGVPVLGNAARANFLMLHQPGEAATPGHPLNRNPVPCSLLALPTIKPSEYNLTARLPRVVGGQVCDLPWARAYATLHSSIVRGVLPARYLGSLFPPTGLADRLLPAVTQLYWAIIAGRALQLIERDDMHYLSEALDATCIQWGVRRGAHSLLFDRAQSDSYKNFNMLTNPEDRFCDEEHAVLSTLRDTGNDLASDAFFLKCSLLKKPTSLTHVPYLYHYSNRGRTMGLWLKNPNHRDELRAIAPASESFKLGWQFLFTPTPATRAVMQPFADLLDACLGNCTQPNMVVAIHIRTQDYVFSERVANSNSTLNLTPEHRKYFECAAAISRRAAPGQRVVWFLSADDLRIRRAAAAAYGDMLVTNSKTAHAHSADELPTDNRRDRRVAGPSAYVTSFADIYLLAKGQYHVLSSNSGFGKIGAYISDGVGAHITYGGWGTACDSHLISRESPEAYVPWSGV
jgi:hypothetical protein